MNMDIQITLSNLKEALEKNSRELKESKETNHLLAVSNLLVSGVISKEEALNDPIYKKYIDGIRKNSVNYEEKTTIKAIIK